MIKLIFESHATTVDNEAHRSSGHADVELSELGLEQAKQLGERYLGHEPDVVFCSDLQRSYRTAEIAFKGREVKIVRDRRLREVDYGELTQFSSSQVDPEKKNRIVKPFSGGESYQDAAKRMKSFPEELLRDYDGQTVMVIGHRATRYGIEHWINGIDLEEAVTAPWSWQPGWEYQFSELAK